MSATATATTVIIDATEWLLGMQSPNGGFAAFDYSNDHLWLNKSLSAI